MQGGRSRGVKRGSFGSRWHSEIVGSATSDSRARCLVVDVGLSCALLSLAPFSFFAPRMYDRLATYYGRKGMQGHRYASYISRKVP